MGISWTNQLIRFWPLDLPNLPTDGLSEYWIIWFKSTWGNYVGWINLIWSPESSQLIIGGSGWWNK